MAGIGESMSSGMQISRSGGRQPQWTTVAICIRRRGDANAKERLVSEWTSWPPLSVPHLIISSVLPARSCEPAYRANTTDGPLSPIFLTRVRKGCNVNERGKMKSTNTGARRSSTKTQPTSGGAWAQRQFVYCTRFPRCRSLFWFRFFRDIADPLLQLKAPCLPRTAPSQAPFRHQSPPRSRPAC